MSQRTKRHHRRPSQGVFAIPDDLSDHLPTGIAPPPPPAARAQAPPPHQERSGGGGVHLPPQPPAKPSEETPASDPSTKG
ncbi:hypothetical protein BUALT_Bualt11G0118300 [Buddleja alternifolia]|uniref:Uncharacterized protein n=1 Tax=Buddleja alternifolia TaxID=168488 RepID=A0AAV6WUE2_9LAMI|nr:hypothetical protein BUALT_Bualt11G0118300 [Buddleja alternifolia]